MPVDFVGNVKKGSKAAKFVYDRLDELLDATPYKSSVTEDEYIEGGDIAGIYLTLSEEQTIDADWIPELHGKKGYNIVFLYGGTEVKGRSFNTFLARNDADDCLHGAMDFSIWKQPGGKRETRGNLHEMFFPEDHDNACFPIAFLQVLYNKGRPYCCVGFNDFPAFKKRMLSLIEQYLGIKDFRNLPTGAEARRIKETGGLLRDNMWLIDFEWISDLATVTMIGEDPEIVDRHNGCSAELQQSRLD
ncbi:MAG: hypothetical protein K5784_05530, partial [Clostridiales bacterium]|nr:hypothetical protein [Clostridiales bacterium]